MYDSPEDNEALLKREEEEEKRKRARRSKADNDGRNYDCSFCGKSYLSYPALYTHKKNKHKEEERIADAVASKSRGRPKARLNDGDSLIEDKVVSAETLEYFSIIERKGETPSDQFPHIFKSVFDEIFVEQWDYLYKSNLKGFIKYTEYDTYPLYTEFLIHFRNPENAGSGEVKCDQVFAEYLYAVSKITNSAYFKKVVKFVFLYREFLNKQHRKEKSEEYTESQTAEDAPDISNEFLIDFINIEDPKMGYSKEEGTQLTQNFCRWMFDENYTTSKLTMK